MTISLELEKKIIDLIEIFNNNYFDNVIKKATILYEDNKSISFFPNIIGACYAAKKEHQKALEFYQKAIILEPNNFEFLNNIGKSQIALKLFDDAEVNFKKSIKINSNNHDSYFNLGIVNFNQDKLTQSLKNYLKAISINDQIDKIHYNKGIVFSKIGRSKDAIKSFLDAIKLNARHIKSFNNLGLLYMNENKYDLAIDYLEQAIKINPKYAKAYNNLGAIYLQKKNYKLANQFFVKAYKLDEKLIIAGVQKIFLNRVFCDWSDDKELINILQKTLHNDDAVPPWFCLSLEDNAFNHFKRAKKFSNKFKLQNNNSNVYNNNKIRIGYFAADFHQHAGMINMEGIFKNHDKNEFEIFAFYYGDIRKDNTHQRIKKYFDKFYYVNDLDDKQICNLSNDCKIDIAIYRAGLTINARSSIFSHKVAPIQINYLGYPGTTGQDGIDYIISDRFVIPKEDEKYYSEKIIFLTDCYYPRDNNRKISSKKFLRKDYKIADDSFVFCSFNNSYKITKQEYEIWMKLLKEVNKSTLLLLASEAETKSNLICEAKKRDISENRLVFLENTNFEDHLSRHSLADLFLDSFNYNAHTSAVDALWTGLPILTKSGNSFSSRICGSILKYINLDEMVTKTNEEYFAKAVELATSSEKYKIIKNKIIQAKLSGSLFDTKKYTRNLEKAFKKVHEMRIKKNRYDTIYIDELK